MLKLKKLQILGFKSFCDRTDLRFQGEGIAAIVGPNGCGKSNISDAISWVLGEQSARTVARRHMQDVIFAGTRDRKPTGMAEVSLTLIDPEVYGDVAEPEIEIHDEMPGRTTWDEAAQRAGQRRRGEEYTEEVRPGQNEEDGRQRDQFHAADPPDRRASRGRCGSTGGQVVLKIRRRKFKRTSRPGEIAVTRRLFRSGESEYLLNGKLCRLRDIQDIFMGTGLGPESYAIIEQGRIGQILSSKPTDRRTIIEEAAGITKFKTRKRLAEARLEDAKQNLARINDIFDEVTRQMNSLKRQAAKAERYAKLRDEMRGQAAPRVGQQVHPIAADASALEQQLAEVSEEMRTRSEAVQQMESEHGERTQRATPSMASRRRTRAAEPARLELDRAAARSRNNEERCAELDARSAGAQAEIGNTDEQLARLQEELAANHAVLESASADVAAAQPELRQRQQEAAAAATSLCRRWSGSRSSVAAISCRPSPPPRPFATASPRRKSAWPRSTASRIAWRGERCRPINRSKFWRPARSARAGIRIGVAAGDRRSAAQIAETRASLDEHRAAETEGKRHLDGLRGEFASRAMASAARSNR